MPLTFTAYLKAIKPGTNIYLAQGFPPGMRDRLISARIKSLEGLCRWVRERYPESWDRYSLIGDGTGRDQCRRVWANYLNWSETHDTRGAR